MRVAVGGAGISGLATALQLLRSGPPDLHVSLIDRQSRVGGWLQTHHDEAGHWEVGPRSIRVSGGDHTLALLHSLGLDPLPAAATSRERYIYYATDPHTPPTMHAMPSALRTWPARMSSLPWSQMLATQMKKSWMGSQGQVPTDDVSMHEFLRGQLGERFASTIGAAMMVGIYAGDSRQLGVRACFPRLHEYFARTGQPTFLRAMAHQAYSRASLRLSGRNKTGEDDSQGKREGTKQKRGGIVDGPSAALAAIGTYSFAEGLEQLPRGMLEEMTSQYEGRFSFLDQSQVVALGAPQKGSGLEIHLAGAHEGSLSFDHYFHTLPAHTTADILERSLEECHKEHGKDLVHQLRAIEYVDVGVVRLQWDQVLATSFEGFGYLVSPQTKEPILGVTFDTQNFPEHRQGRETTRMTAMMGGHPAIGVPLHEHSQDALMALAADAVQRHMKIPSPDHATIHLHRKAIPQYYTGHHRRVAAIEQAASSCWRHSAGNEAPWTLLGNYLYGVSINDCIRVAQNRAQQWCTSNKS